MRTLLKFTGVGALSTLLQVLLLMLFVELGYFAEIAASAIAYLMSAVFNYVANYYLTFASQQAHTSALPKFALAVAIGALVNTGVFAVALDIFESSYLLSGFTWLQSHIQSIFGTALTNWLCKPYLWAQGTATLLTLIVNFLIHTFWIYKKG